MFLRAIMSFIPISEGNIVDDFVYTITEPFVTPVRIVLSSSESIDSLPVDVAFFVSFLLLSILNEMISAFCL